MIVAGNNNLKQGPKAPAPGPAASVSHIAQRASTQACKRASTQACKRASAQA